MIADKTMSVAVGAFTLAGQPKMVPLVYCAAARAGVRARGFRVPAAGKTGTSHDGWFAGFTSQLLCVVWVGFDDDRQLNLEGAKSALPIWTEFMKRALEYRGYRDAKKFPVPSGIARVNLCSESRQLATPGCSATYPEYFVDGSQPANECQLHSTSQPNSDASESSADLRAATLVLRYCRCPHPIGIRRLPTGASCPLPRRGAC